MKSTDFEALAKNEELLEVGRRAVEKMLVEFRDSRLSEQRGNGLVIKEKDGTLSSTIRFGMETALKIAFKAMAEHRKSEESS
jgi:hypothetical protein